MIQIFKKAACTAALVLTISAVANAQWDPYPWKRVPRTADGKVDLNAPAAAHVLRQARSVRLLDAGKSGQEPAEPGRRPEAGRRAAQAVGAGPLQSAHRKQRQGSPRRVLSAVRHSGKGQHSRWPEAGADRRPDAASARIPHHLPADLHRWHGRSPRIRSPHGWGIRSAIGTRTRSWWRRSDRTARPGSTCEGIPGTESLRVTERFSRPKIGHMDIEVTIDDPEAYTKPWTVKLAWRLVPDTDLIESICEENNRDPAHMVGK